MLLSLSLWYTKAGYRYLSIDARMESVIGELKVEVMEDDWFRDGGIEMVLCDGGEMEDSEGKFQSLQG